MPLTVSVPRIFSSFCQAVRWTLPPSVSQSAPQLDMQPAARATTTGNVRIPILVTKKRGGRAECSGPAPTVSLLTISYFERSLPHGRGSDRSNCGPNQSRDREGAVACLELESRRQNHLSRLNLRAGDGAEVRVGLGQIAGRPRLRGARIGHRTRAVEGETGTRVVGVEVVERIEALNPELQALGFRDLEVLGQGEVEVEHSGAVSQRRRRVADAERVGARKGEVGGIEGDLQARILSRLRNLARGQIDIAPHLAAERNTAGGRTGPVTDRRVGGAATDIVGRTDPELAVSVDVPIAEHCLGEFVVDQLVAGKVEAEIEIDGLGALGADLGQLRVHPLGEGVD